MKRLIAWLDQRWYWGEVAFIVGLYLSFGVLLIGLTWLLEGHDNRDWWFEFVYLAIGLLFGLVQGHRPKRYQRYEKRSGA